MIVLALFLCFLGIIHSVEKDNFKTCQQSGFCKRFIDLPPNEKRFLLLRDSATCRNGSVEADYRDTDYKFNSQVRLKVEYLEGGIVRAKMTQLDTLHKRIDLYKDILKVKLPNSKPIKTIQSRHKCELTVSKNTKIIVDLEKLSFWVLKDNFPRFIFNHDGLLKLEAFVNSKGEQVRVDQEEEFEEEKFDIFKDKQKRGHEAVSAGFLFKDFNAIYGLPEHTDDFMVNSQNEHPFRLYNLDVSEYELKERMALYGSVPYLMAQSPDLSLGLFWNNPSETWVLPKSKHKNIITSLGPNSEKDTVYNFVSETGILDMFLLLGPTAKTVSKQLAQVTAFQQMPPLFALGYHQSKWNYKNQQEVLDIASNFEKHNIPFDGIWLDIDHTNAKHYFTWNHDLFPEPLEMSKLLATKKRKLMTIVNPHVAANAGYHVYDSIIKNNFAVESSENVVFKGQSWPGDSVYPDFLNPLVQTWFSNLFKVENYPQTDLNVHSWIDMNEPSVNDGPEKTLPKSVLHHGGVEHREIHNIYGQLYHKVAFEGSMAKTQEKLRPFVLSRSFYAGSQKYGAVWTGDNAATWAHLKAVIPMLLSLSISGIHFCGADIGGFLGDPDPELLTRWYQLAAFTPFMRSHAHIDSPYREPWLFKDSTFKSIKLAIEKRYFYLPYLYQLFHTSHTKGLPVMRPLFYEFGNETMLYGAQESFMFGDALLIKPILQPKVNEVKFMFPGHLNDYWYNVNTFKRYHGHEHATIKVSIDDIPVFQRGGTIVPRYDRLRRSASLYKNIPISIYICLNSNGFATGKIYIDDFDSNDHLEGEYLEVHLRFRRNVLQTKVVHKPRSMKFDVNFDKIMLSGLERSGAGMLTIQSGEKTSSGMIIPHGSPHLHTHIVRAPDLPVSLPLELTITG